MHQQHTDVSRTHHERQDETAHALSYLRRDVAAELDERCEEALEFAELSGAARGRQLLRTADSAGRALGGRGRRGGR